MKRVVVAAVACCAALIGCREAQERVREPLRWSGWIEETAVRRGSIQPGDIGQFGCPPGWRAVEDTAAALRGREVSTVYVGADPSPFEGTLTCVAQAEFDLPAPAAVTDPPHRPQRRPLAPVWVDVAVDSVTIGFRSELPLHAPIYIARETPCGPRVIGVRLGDLLTWLVDPRAATKRDFLGMTSGGCPERAAPQQNGG